MTHECRLKIEGMAQPIPYLEAWEEQKRLAEARLNGDGSDTLLLLQHAPTITLGRNAKEADILASRETLCEAGVEIVRTNRGGDVTYHGPGQLIGYPILKIDEPPYQRDIHGYFRQLEETLILALAEFGIAAGRFPPHTGVWVELNTPHPRKIAAMGIHVSRWVTTHGFALNVSPNMEHFHWIVPCDIWDYGVVSLSELLGREVPLEEAIAPVCRAFEKVFGVELRRESRG